MKTFLKMKTKSAGQTQKLAQILAKKIKKLPAQSSALIIALKGNLGSGKTTFVKGLAKGLGVKETIKSPSFVILKIFELPKSVKNFNHLIHIDA